MSDANRYHRREDDASPHVHQRDLDKLKEEFVAQLDAHTEKEAEWHNEITDGLKEVKVVVTQIQKLFEQSKGALTVIKWIGYVAVGAWGVLIWARDHLKL